MAHCRLIASGSFLRVATFSMATALIWAATAVAAAPNPLQVLRLRTPHPVQVVADGGEIWVRDGQRITRRDARTGRVLQTLAGGRRPLFSDGSRVWALGEGGSRLRRLDRAPKAAGEPVVIRLPVQRLVQALAVAGVAGGLWVATGCPPLCTGPPNQLRFLRAPSYSPRVAITLPSAPYSSQALGFLAGRGGRLWTLSVAGTGADGEPMLAVEQRDSSTGVVRRRTVLPPGSGFPYAGFVATRGALWYLTERGRLLRIGRDGRILRGGRFYNGLAADATSLWALRNASTTVERLDLATGRTLQRVQGLNLEGRSTSITVAAGRLWLSDELSDQLISVRSN